MFTNKNRPFYNFGRHFELDVIESRHWREFVTAKFGSSCPENCFGRILEITANHPYFTQMYCHYLWDYSREHKGELQAEDLEIVLEEIIRRESLFYTELWDMISASERRLLKALAVTSTASLYEKDFLVKYSLGTASSVQKASEKLLSLDYIRKDKDGIIQFVNPLFKQWILFLLG